MSSATTMLHVLSVARAVAHEYGLRDVPLYVALSACVRSGQAVTPHVRGLVDDLTGEYVDFVAVSVGEGSPPLFTGRDRGVLDIALILAHEQTHCMLNATAPLVLNTECWFDEGLAELVMVKTAIRLGDPGVARTFVGRELQRIANVGELVVDLPRWRCLLKGSMRANARLKDGRTRALGPADRSDPAQIQAYLEDLRALSQSDELESAEEKRPNLVAVARLVEEWLALARKPLAADELDVSDGRQEPYALGMALLLELEDSGANLGDVVSRLRQEQRLLKVPHEWSREAPSVVSSDERVIATSDELNRILSGLGHLDITMLARAYPVKRARARLEALLRSVKD